MTRDLKRQRVPRRERRSVWVNCVVIMCLFENLLKNSHTDCDTINQALLSNCVHNNARVLREVELSDW